MAITFLLLKSLIFLYIFSYGKSKLEAEQCPKYECKKESSTDTKKCSSYSASDDKYTLESCTNRTYCDFKSNKVDSYCVNTKYDALYDTSAFVGGSCEENKDCLSHLCQDHQCISAKENSCSSTSECPFGQYCNDSQCVEGLDVNGDCTKDEECKFNLGCLHNKCTEFFSKDNGFNMTEKNGENLAFFCKSGRIYNGLCGQVRVAETDNCELDKPCEYYNENNNKIQIENTCKCTVSTNPTTKCMLGDMDLSEKWKEIIDILKQTYTDYKDKCNLSEKRLKFCTEYMRNDWDIRKRNINLTRLMIEYENAVRFDDTVDCSLTTAFSFDSTGPLPRKKIFQCPTYKCGELDFDNKTCAYSQNPFTELGNNITVNLQKDICAYGYKCDYDVKKTYENWNYNSTCIEIPSSKTWKIKYPGEQCTSHDQCHKGSEPSIGWCIDGVCSGKQKDEECKNHTDCVKGYFCNGLYCERQKGENNFCLDQYECLNYLGCYMNTCKPYYSLKNGTKLNETNPDRRLCEMNRIDETTNQCAERAYHGVKEEDLTEDGFLKCEIGYNCNYTTGFYHNGKIEVETEPCQCGYSSEGQSYCPLPQNINKKYWDKMYKLMNKRLDNDCHTSRRFECYDELSEKQSDEDYFYQRKTVKAHLFKDASNCIIEVLHSNYMKISFISLSFIILLLL